MMILSMSLCMICRVPFHAVTLPFLCFFVLMCSMRVSLPLQPSKTNLRRWLTNSPRHSQASSTNRSTWPCVNASTEQVRITECSPIFSLLFFLALVLIVLSAHNKLESELSQLSDAMMGVKREQDYMMIREKVHRSSKTCIFSRPLLLPFRCLVCSRCHQDLESFLNKKGVSFLKYSWL